MSERLFSLPTTLPYDKLVLLPGRMCQSEAISEPTVNAMFGSHLSIYRDFGEMEAHHNLLLI